MNTIEERIRAAARAAADTVPPDSVPPLRLPAPDTNGQAARGVPGWARWLATAAAAAAVAAIAIAMALAGHSVRDSGAASQAGIPVPGPMKAGPPISSYVASGQIPRYYVVIQPRKDSSYVPQDAAVRATVTGKSVEVIKPSVPGGTIVAVTAADDRTFVLDEQVLQPNHIDRQNLQPRTFFLLRLDPAGRVSALIRLPVPVPSGTILAGFALSPDETMLATATEPGHGSAFPSGPVTFSVHDLRSGAERTWTGPGIVAGIDNPRALSWTADQRTLAFNWWGTEGGIKDRAEVRLLDLTTGGGDLLGSSRRLVVWWNQEQHGKYWFQVLSPTAESAAAMVPFLNSGNAIITPDGSAVICGAQRMVRLESGARPVREQGFFEFSTRTGRVTGIQGAWEPSSTPFREVLWSSSSGRVLIGVVNRQGFGVIRGNEFTPLNVPKAPFPGDTTAW